MLTSAGWGPDIFGDDFVFENPKMAKSAPIAMVSANQHLWLACVCFLQGYSRLCVAGHAPERLRVFVEGRSFLWIADLSSTTVNCACFVLNDERPFRLTAFA